MVKSERMIAYDCNKHLVICQGDVRRNTECTLYTATLGPLANHPTGIILCNWPFLIGWDELLVAPVSPCKL